MNKSVHWHFWVNVVFAVIGEQGLGDCQISPVVRESCKLSVFSCNEGFDFNEMLSHDLTISIYIHGRCGWNNDKIIFSKAPGLIKKL